jgi:hypothetical protein
MYMYYRYTYILHVHPQYVFSYNEQLAVVKQHEIPVLCCHPERASMPKIQLNALLYIFAFCSSYVLLNNAT